MHKTLKKTLSVLLSALLLMTAIPFAFAADEPSSVITDEAGFKAALEAGGEYSMGADITLTDSACLLDEVTTVIDMNGFDVSGGLWDITVETGKLTMFGGSFSEGVYLNANSGTVNLRDVILNGSPYYSYTVSAYEGKVILENVTANCGDCRYAVDVYNGEAVIIGGEYTCGDDCEIIRCSGNAVPDVKIYGGTFSKSVADFVAEGYTETEVDGKFVVTSDKKGTAGEGVNWEIDYYGTLNISGTGDIVTDAYAPPWKEYNDIITAAVIEEGITGIDSTAFAYAENMKTVSIPSTVTNIGGIAFWGCESLEQINVHEDNANYKSIDGILFSEDEKTLVSYPANKEGTEYTVHASVTTLKSDAFGFNQALRTLIIPDTVTSIGSRFIANSKIENITLGNGITELEDTTFAHSDLRSMVIPDSVKSLGYGLFWSASDIENLIIGSGVESIGEDILRYTNSLTTVHYKGTQEQWDAISIHEENADLNAKVIHFISDEDFLEEVAPTCADGHSEGYYCSDCEAYITGEVFTAVDEHTPGEAVVENIIPPTCTEAGTKDIVCYCTVCLNETSRETVETDAAIGHNWIDGACYNCGEACTHTDYDFDDICDLCGEAYVVEVIKLDEINTVSIVSAQKEVVVRFIPEESGPYVICSYNGGDDEAVDPYVEVYDSIYENIALDDDADGTYNFYCEFYAEAGEIYTIYLYAYNSEVTYNYVIKKNAVVSHQPTADEPYVELSWDVGAEYQWYELEFTEITDENAEAYSYNDETATYDAENGWTPVLDSDGYYSSATIELKKDDMLIVTFKESGFEYIGLWDFSAGHEGDYCHEEDGTLVYNLVADADGIYTVYTSEPIALSISAYSENKTAIEGADTNFYAATEEGYYVCEITLEDGKVIMSELYEGPHTHGYEANVTAPTCTETGFTTYTCDICGDSYVADETEALGHSYDDGVVTAPTCTAKGYTTYTCGACGDSYLSDETDALGHSFENGVCTLCGENAPSSSDEPTETECDHLCHKDGFLGFIWKIICFFYRLFDIQQYCDCGQLHYDAPLFG